MKKILAALAATALVFTLASCSDSTDEGASPTVTVTEQAPEPETPDYEPGGPVADSAFVSVMREEFPYDTAGVSDSEIIELGEATCTAIGSWNEDIAGLLNYLISPPDALDPYFAAFVIGASVPAFCPQYQPAVDDFINGGSGGYGTDL